jgi:drug/metabolite transporter (DMT)-like permease
VTTTAREPAASGSKGLAFAAMLLAAGSWAIAFPLVTVALRVMTPLPLSSIRFTCAGMLALGWILWKRAPFPSWPHVLRYLACGFTGSACYSVFINMGQATVSAGAASFITNIIPILTALIAWPWLGERLNWAGWFGCIIGFVGVSYIALDQPGGLSFGAGAMFVFLASLGASVYFVLQKPLIEDYGAMPCTAYTLLFSALFLVPWFPNAIAQAAQADPRAFMAIVGLILFPTVVAYVGAVYALGELPAGITTTLFYLVSPLATVFAFVVLGDIPSPATLIGGALAIIGTMIVAKWGKATTALVSPAAG